MIIGIDHVQLAMPHGGETHARRFWVDLMGLAGFCRNCLADWIREAGYAGDKDAARELIHGMPMDEWKATRQSPATEEQIGAMEASLTRNKADLR